MKFTYSLRTLLVICVVVGIVLAMLGPRIASHFRGSQVIRDVQRIDEIGGRYTARQFKTSDGVATMGYVGLVFKGRSFTDETIAEIEPSLSRMSVRWLDLSDADISNESVELIGRHTDFLWLSLAGCDVDDAGIRHLHGCTQLEFLDLSGTKVTEEGVDHLRRALPRTKIKRE